MIQFFRKYLSKESKILFKNSSWVFLANITRVLLLFVRSIFLAKGLGVEVYGNYITILALIASIQSFFNLNFGTILIKFGAEYIARNDKNSLLALIKLSFLSTTITLVISFFFISGLVFLISDFFIKEPGLEWFIIILAIANGLQFFDYISQSFLRLYYKFKLNSIISIIMAVIEIGIVIIAVHIYHDDFPRFLLLVALGRLLSSLACNFFAFWEVKDYLKGYQSISIKIIEKDYKLIYKFLTANYGSRLLKNIIEQGDVLLLSSLSSSTQVGLYGVGKRLGYAVLSVVDPLVNAIFPQFSLLVAKKKYSELMGVIKQMSLILTLFSVLFLIVIYLIKLDLVVLVYGIEYIDAANIFFVVMLAALVAGSTFWNTSLLLSLGEVNYRFKMYLFLLVIGFASSWIIIPIYSAIGVAFILLLIKSLEAALGCTKSIDILNKFIKNDEKS
ncbi:MAG: oligosaccharide flippase family protein [Saprospiraceae bacterium]|nr:oligosaccharide flippase family protein [Saprospiraceae bacterium]